jgi:transcriptional regulator of nitric oxide reductase/NAD-dependent dihydropyrimidine dehydrogenase PreA subunit
MHVRDSFEGVRGVCIALIALVFASPAIAEQGKLRERLTPEVMAVVYPGAERLGMEEGSPPAIAVFKGDQIVAYVFSTLDIIAAPGYSTTPFDVIAGVDLSGRITGAKVVFHQESMIVHDRVRQRQIDTLLAREAGRPLRGGTNALPPDYVDGATISARAMRAAVLTTARLVLRAHAARTAVTAPTAVTTVTAASTAETVPTLDLESFSIKSWDDLLAGGAVVRRRVTSGEVATALTNAGAAAVKLDWPLGTGDDLYIEFMTALVTPPAIGGNLLGLLKFEDYKRELPRGAQAIYVASNGPYDFLGTKYFRESEGNRFDRLRVIQDGKTFGFVQRDYSYATPIQGQQVTGLFALPANSGFNPLKPWRLDILINSAGTPPLTVAFGLDYKIPDAHVLQVPVPRVLTPQSQPQSQPQPQPQSELEPEQELLPPVPAWVEAWSDARVNIAILAVLLSVLTLIFIFQSTLARFRIAHRLVRTGFLLVVLGWLGWTAGVQLSILNVMNYVSAPFNHFEIGFYLAEPLMVIIAGYTLVSVVLIGRGVFCGWLCPFGALQELLGQLSRALRVPQWNPPVALEKRLWMGKYIAAAAVLTLVMTQIDAAGATLEIEPFKTAITTRFTRAWPYVIYAGALLAIGLFSERAYCRFLCPMGGVLAFLDRLHLLNLLKRRPECGSPCHLCEHACPVGAIEPTGRIVTAECFQCLDCQVEYHDEKRCPPLVRTVKLRREAKPSEASPRQRQ